LRDLEAAWDDKCSGSRPESGLDWRVCVPCQHDSDLTLRSHSEPPTPPLPFPQSQTPNAHPLTSSPTLLTKPESGCETSRPHGIRHWMRGGQWRWSPLNPAPSTLRPHPHALISQPCTLNLKPYNQNPALSTITPKPSTIPKPSTLNSYPEPSTTISQL